MKTKFFIAGYFGVLLLAIFVRMIQVFNYYNQYTGFFKNSKPVFFSVLVIVLVLVFSALAFYVKRCPLKMPKMTFPLSLASFIVAGGMLNNAFFLYQNMASATSLYLSVLKIGLNVVCAVFFAAYGLKKYVHFHIKRILYTVPLFYWLFTVVESYVNISRTALIFENGIMIVSTVLICIYFLYFAKVANNIPSGQHTYKIILFFGSLSSMSCEVFAIPQIYAIMSGTQKVLHNDLSVIFTYLAAGIFIQVFTLTFFSNKNLFKKRHKTAGSDKILPTSIDIETMKERNTKQSESDNQN